LSERLGGGPRVTAALEHAYARWDGKVFFDLPRGESISFLARIVHLVHVAQVFHRAGGRNAADEVVRSRRGTEFDPQLADLWLADRGELLPPLGPESDLDQRRSAQPRRMGASAPAPRPEPAGAHGRRAAARQRRAGRDAPRTAGRVRLPPRPPRGVDTDDRPRAGRGRGLPVAGGGAALAPGPDPVGRGGSAAQGDARGPLRPSRRGRRAGGCRAATGPPPRGAE